MNRVVVIKLRELLTNRKLEQKQLAEMTGLSVRAISDLANDKTERVPKTALLKIADALNIEDIRELIDFKE